MSNRYPIVDVIRFKYPLAVIKRIELSYDTEGHCIEEIITIANNPQVTNKSFLEEQIQQQTTTASNLGASSGSNQVSQNQQQWITGNNYWALTPVDSVWIEPNNSGTRFGGAKRQFNRPNCSDQQIAKIENELNAFNDQINN